MASIEAVEGQVPVPLTRPRASSNYSLFNTQPEPTAANIPQLRPRAKSSSNVGIVPLEPKFEFEDHTLIDEEGNYKRRYGVAELIDFLKNYPPPADNYMSIPDTRKAQDKGTWAKIRKLAKRQSLSEPPDPIRLPDSAISGITTGGHRHIAISIPLDASPFGRTPRSQYPVYSIRGVKGSSSRYGPTRAVLNEKGVVTVLRTVNEETESPVAKKSAARDRSSAPARTRSRSRGSSLSKSHSRANSTNSNGRGKVSDYFGVSSSPPRPGPLDQFKRAKEASQEQSNSRSPAGASTESKQDGSFPARGSSLVANRFVFPSTSIDAMMKETSVSAAPAVPSQAQSNSDTDLKEPSSKNVTKPTETEPISPKPTEPKPPVSLEEAPVITSSTMTEETDVMVITKSPVSRGDGHISPTPSVASSQDQTRRQKVRDKKRRDMEALRSSKRQSLQSEPDTTSARNSKISEPEVVEAEPRSPGRKEKPPPLPLKSPGRHSLSAIVVITDVQPSPPQSEVPQSPADESQPPQSPADSQPAPSPAEESLPAESPSTQLQNEVAQLGMTQVVMAPPRSDIERPLTSPPLIMASRSRPRSSPNSDRSPFLGSPRSRPSRSPS